MSDKLRVQVNKNLPLRSRRLEREEMRNIFGMAGGSAAQGESCNNDCDCGPGLYCTEFSEDSSVPTWMDSAQQVADAVVPGYMWLRSQTMGIDKACQTLVGR